MATYSPGVGNSVTDGNRVPSSGKAEYESDEGENEVAMESDNSVKSKNDGDDEESESGDEDSADEDGDEGDHEDEKDGHEDEKDGHKDEKDGHKDEKSTEEILAWKAKVEGMHSPNAIRRWYLDISDDATYTGTQTPTKPCVSDVKESLLYVLPMDDIEIGFYELVMCVSLKDTNVNSIKSIMFDTSEITKSQTFYEGDMSAKTIVKNQDLRAFPQEDFARLRFHRPAEHSLKDRDQSIEAIFTLENGCPKTTITIHYIELQHCQYRSTAENKDHVIYGEGQPDQIISVGPDDTPKQSIELSTFQFSETGDYVATLYFTDDLAHVDVWDLRSLDNHNDTPDQQQEAVKTTQVFNQAFASATIEVPKRFPDQASSMFLEHLIGVSDFGTQVAISIVKEDEGDQGVLFRVLKVKPAAPADKDPSQPWRLEKINTTCESKRSIRMSYHITDSDNKNEDDERFWMSDGLSVSVYDTKGSWSLLYTLKMQSEFDTQTCGDIVSSMQGRYFAWTGSRGAISIWDFETGKLISHVYSGDDKNAAYPVLSPDGSKVALCVRNKIEIRDTMTGIKLGVLKKGVGQENYLEVVFEKEHFLMYNVEAATVSKPMTHNARSVVRVHDMKIVKTLYMHEDYEFQLLSPCHDLVFAYSNGPSLNILRTGPILEPVVAKDVCGGFDNCKRKAIEIIPIFGDSNEEFVNAAGSKFILTSSTDLSLGDYIRFVRVSVAGKAGRSSDTDTRSMVIPVGLDLFEYSTFFLPETSQLGLVTNGCLSLWTLSAKPSVPFCRLSFIWRFEKSPEGAKPEDICLRDPTLVESCEHGRNLKIKLSPLEWYRFVSDITEDGIGAKEDTLTVPVSAEDTLSATEEYRLNQGFVGLIEVYALGDNDCKEAVIRYLKAHLRQNRERRSISPINSICGAWTQDRRPFVESIISRLLPIDVITWVPDIYANKENNPLSIVLKTAETSASALGITRIIMDYCVSHAGRSRNLAFLAPFFGALHQCMEIFPDEAFERLGRIAYVPVMHRTYILNHSTIARPPQFRLQFWKPSSKLLCEVSDPILQLDVPATETDPDNDKFTKPIFMASFDALWYYTDDKKLPRSKLDPKAEEDATYTTTWWKTLYHMLRLKTRLRVHNYVETYNFSIEFYDNPAIAALVAYKWNTIGYWYWFVRFFFQCCFYALVIIASIMQVYYPQPSKLLGLFIAIIVMAVVFIWLELLQAIRSMNRYVGSGYNFLDMIAFSLPLAASIDQIVVISQGDTQGNTHLLSFSVLAVFLHMLFELRINKSVCKYVTIIQEAVYEIQAFFIIFAAGIVAFAIATLHLLRSCPYEGCDAPTTGFSSDFVGALFDTYFFMGGRWDPVSDEFTSAEFAFQLMMALFFFFTVILMLNVLIALINVAFAKGDDGWRLVWIESRLRYIESAENMSYHIPGFRQTHNYFPKEIYFSATTKQVQEYREKYHNKDKATEDLDVIEKWLRGPSYLLDEEEVDADVTVDGATSDDEEDVEEIKKDTKEVSKGSDEKIGELKIADPGSASKAIVSTSNNGASGSNVTVNTTDSGASSSNVIGSNVQKLEEKTTPDNAKDAQKESPPLQQDSDGSTSIRSLNVQVVDLKTQVSNLQKQLSEQLATHQEQLVAQQGQLATQQEQTQRQLEELKNLLLMRPSMT